MAKEKPALHECRALIRYYDREERNLLQPDRNESVRELACLNSTGRLFFREKNTAKHYKIVNMLA
jgi:hypothetical protein